MAKTQTKPDCVVDDNPTKLKPESWYFKKYGNDRMAHDQMIEDALMEQDCHYEVAEILAGMFRAFHKYGMSIETEVRDWYKARFA